VPDRARPRLAIIGGGGAMGRLFARILSTATEELFLLDFFGTGSRPASLSKTLEDLRQSVERRGWTVSPALSVSAASAGWRVGPAALNERGLLRFQPATRNPDQAPLGRDWIDLPTQSLAELLDGCLLPDSTGSLLYAGLPEDGPSVLPRADVVLLALGFESEAAFAATLDPYLAYLSPGTLLVDLGSTKSGPMAVLQRRVPPNVGVLGAHPLFSPMVSDLTGLIVATVDPSDGRPASPWREWFLSQLAEARVIVTPTDADEHDDAMAFVQALTHFALLSLANTFVRLDRDPANLLAFRTPVFEPLLYLAARVAHLAATTPETYRAIQTFSTRPDARQAFLDSAREILQAVERNGETPDPLVELFRRYGRPWSPEGRDRRERQVREHFLEMGVRLVDGLNQLRQDVVAAVGEVRAVEERRTGQAPRIVVGVVALDLLAPGKRDVASRIRLRRLNLPLGSLQGAVLGEEATGDDGQDLIIPLARARLLSDEELIAWLYATGQLVEWQPVRLELPVWFDRETLLRLLRGMNDRTRDRGSRVWDLRVEADTGEGDEPGCRPVTLHLAVVLHPADLVAARRVALDDGADAFRTELAAVEARLEALYAMAEGDVGTDSPPAERSSELAREKDRLKKARKKMLDERIAQVDRTVRREARARVQAITASVVEWLIARGSAPIRC